MGNRVQHKLTTAMALPMADKVLLGSALLCLPLFWLALRLLGLRRVQAWLAIPAAPERTPQISQAQHLARLVNRAAQQPWIPATCLSRSLLLQWFLARHGIASELRIGIDKRAGDFNAHAWVECAGFPINDHPAVAQRFAAFPALRPEKPESA
ncbi:MAG: lasso peptide biosynthesis B2 protein [Caldilineaceae bacterium]|nr:lasso peptide biosynthesis B2 protein [Caldilineaceae bacterium]